MSTRRQFLATLSASALLAGCGSPPFEPGPEPSQGWVPDGDADDSRFPHGIQLADVTPQSVLVAVRSDNSSGLSVELVIGTAEGWEPVAATVSSRQDYGDGVWQIEVSELTPDTTYSLIAVDADGNRSAVSRFRTAIPSGESRALRFGATSCLGGNFPWPSLSRAAEAQLDLFLLMGDTVYNDWWEGTATENWSWALEQKGMRDLCASTSLIATWDDHEVRNNWDPESTSSAALAESSLLAFQGAIPQRGGAGSGIWRSLKWGDTAEFFVLDCRGERKDGNYISPEQMTWLKAALTESEARFKIILNSVPIVDFSDFGPLGDIGAGDRWQGYKTQRDELIAHVVDIPGVLFVSGDFHVGATARIDGPAGPAENLFEVLTGPGGSPISSQYGLVPESDRMPVVVTEWNYTLFELDPDTGRVDVTYIADDGATLRKIRLDL